METKEKLVMKKRCTENRENLYIVPAFARGMKLIELLAENPEGLVMAVVDHDGSSLLHRGGGGGTCPSWQAGNLQYRPGIAVHLHRLHRRAEEVTDRHLDGWQGCVARQCLRRAALAFDQIRGSLPPCLQDCVRGTRWHRPISELLQHQTPTFIP